MRVAAQRLRRFLCAHSTRSVLMLSTETTGRRLKVAVGMSGGVDSSVAALLLCRAGHEVVGVHMRNWDRTQDALEECAGDADWEDASAVCATLGIPLLQVDLAREYWLSVFEPFVDAYRSGTTPNPDTDCNRYIKFDAFVRHCVDRLGADLVATGHYAMLADGGRTLLRAKDQSKDQSYFLATTKGAQFERVVFPIGHLLKSEVRLIAAQHFPGHRVLSKHESAGICFIGRRRLFARFLDQFIAPSPGSFVDVDTGKELGKHAGKELYTVGQKARIHSQESKTYVVGTGADGSVLVARGAAHPALFSHSLLADARLFSWVAGGTGLARRARGSCAYLGAPRGVPHGSGSAFRCSFKSRYNSSLGPCAVRFVCADSDACATRECTCSDAAEPSYLLLAFDSPDRAVTPGQIVVLYDGEECLGGGPILRGLSSYVSAKSAARAGAGALTTSLTRDRTVVTEVVR